MSAYTPPDVSRWLTQTQRDLIDAVIFELVPPTP